MRPKTYTEFQENYVILYSSDFTVKELSKQVGLGIAVLYALRKKYGLQFKKEAKREVIDRPPAFHQPAVHPDPERPKIVRPPAIYSNQRSVYGIEY